MNSESTSKSVRRRPRLAACPGAPNCVCSQSAEPARTVPAIGYAIERAVARDILLAELRSWPRTAIVERADDYIHATQRSRWFGFVDDLECHLPPDEALIHVRSASRTGYYDFGVNRARVDRLRRAVNRRLARAQ